MDKGEDSGHEFTKCVSASGNRAEVGGGGVVGRFRRECFRGAGSGVVMEPLQGSAG